MDGIVGLVMFVTVVFLICSLCGWCCHRKQKGVVFSRPGDNITNPYDPNYGQVNPYPTQSIGPAGTAQHVPVQHQPPPGMAPYQPTSYPAGAGPYSSYIPPTNTVPPYPMVGPAGSAPPLIPPSTSLPYPPGPTYPSAVPVGTAPKLPTYQEATGDATSGNTSVTNELYTKQAPYNPNFN
ncbi:cyclin-K-like isoform X2 [Chrysoperla carnea]|nr:cyclin-K-like isoform X2 [Chrysoperla carnea]